MGEIEQFERELANLPAADAVMQDPLTLLQQVREEVLAGRPISPPLLTAMASLAASPEVATSATAVFPVAPPSVSDQGTMKPSWTRPCPSRPSARTAPY